MKGETIAGIAGFFTSFDRLLKSNFFANQDELKREYIGLAKDYSKLKELVEYEDKNAEQGSSDKLHLPGLQPSETDIVARLGQLQRIRRGTRIIREGANGTNVFFILAGKVDIFKSTSDGRKEHVCQLGEGNIIGEYGAFFNVKRTADVIVTQDVSAFVLNTKKLESHKQLLADLKSRITQFKSLQSASGLEGVPFAFIRGFFDMGEVKRFAREQDIFKQGDWAEAMYFILEGEVEVIKDKDHLRTLHKGDFFGEVALLKKTTRTATVRALSAVDALELNHLSFLKAIANNFSVAIRIDKIVKERLNRFR